MIPFLDLAADFAEVETQARARIDGVLARQLFVLGPETAELERALGERTGAAAAIACSSGTDALYLALLALGIGPGDAVVVPAFSFFASAGAVARAGARPLFCDVAEDTLLCGRSQVEAAIERATGGAPHVRQGGERVRAILPVHLYGAVAPMPALVAHAREHALVVIEDAAQAIGARLDGIAAGTFGDAGCLSFYPTKNLGGAGDGGMVLAGDEALASRLRRLRVHGAEPGSYEHEEAGINARMSELVAAVLNAKLVRLDAWTLRRRRIAELYLEGLAEPAARGESRLPPMPAQEDAHVWHQVAVRVRSDRDGVRARLAAGGVATAVFYPRPLHLQPAFAALGYRPGDLPVAEDAAARVLCLPVRPSMTDDDVRLVCERLTTALAGAR